MRCPDQGQRTAVKAWRGILLAIAREEMGHLMSVQNMLLLLRLPPNFEREDFPPRKDIYPFTLHLQPITQVSLAKYVVAESPVAATGIDDIRAKAEMEAGAAINHVGICTDCSGLIFARADQVDSGGSGSAAWDGMVRQIRDAAYKQNPDPAAWHLPDEVFDPESISQQGDPDDWDIGELRVHRVADRDDARQAIRDIGEQGEGRDQQRAEVTLRAVPRGSIAARARCRFLRRGVGSHTKRSDRSRSRPTSPMRGRNAGWSWRTSLRPAPRVSRALPRVIRRSSTRLRGLDLRGDAFASGLHRRPAHRPGARPTGDSRRVAVHVAALSFTCPAQRSSGGGSTRRARRPPSRR